MKTTHWLRLLLILVAVSLLPSLSAAPTDPLPFDPSVRVGKLPNGLTYYIRRNAKPEKRVELRLAVNTGSIQEDNDQLGLAHLIEHLCFTGTKSFPKTDLIHYLQSVGSNFGPDVNAYTKFDETVYMLSLPTDKPDVLTNGLQIMREWAHDVVFDPKAIDLERKVVVEEWRLGRGAQQRMLDKFLPVVFKDSKYADRLPIGTKDSIESMSYATIERFYHDWYRPDLMAFIVVGDIDPDKMEADIKARFGSIPKPEQARPIGSYEIPDNVAPLYSIVSDKENPYNQVVLAFKTPRPRYDTVGEYRQSLVQQLFLEALNLRLAELRQQANPPFVYAGAAYGHLWVRPKGAYQLFCVVPDGGIDRGFSTLLTENERVRQHGFTPAEFERAKAMLMRSLEQRYLDRDKTESNQLVNGYVEHFLADDPDPGIAFDFGFAKQHIGGITLDEINALPKPWVTSKNRLIVVESVEKPNVPIPSESELQAAATKVAQEKIDAYAEKQLPKSLLPTKPAPGQIVGRKTMADIGVTELTLSNGIRVVLKPSDFKNDEIVFSAFRPGGASVFPDDYTLSAELATPYARESGVGPFSAPDLQKMLAGKIVSVSPQIGDYYDRMSGHTTPQDLETALQLVHLYFTAPRSDPGAFQSVAARQRAILQNARLNPIASFFDQAERIRYNNHPRTPHVIPTDADWATVSFEKVNRVYHERFGDASGFTFVFVGAFKPEAIEPLVATYLGSLPTHGNGGAYKDTGLRAVDGPLVKDITSGTDPRSIVILSLAGPAEYSLAQSHQLWALHNIIERALIDKLRLELGGVYTVQTQCSIDRAPYPHFSFDILIPCSPGNVPKLVAAATAEIERIRKEGVRADEIEKEVETERRQFEKDAKENGPWDWKLGHIYQEHEDFTRVAHPEELVALVTADNMKRTANQYLDPSKLVRFTMYPAAAPAAPAGAAAAASGTSAPTGAAR